MKNKETNPIIINLASKTVRLTVVRAFVKIENCSKIWLICHFVISEVTIAKSQLWIGKNFVLQLRVGKIL